jgi:YidC/Oxa1 family membrane protein insertase
MNWQKNITLVAIAVVAWLLIVRWSDYQNQFDQVVDSQPPVQLETPQYPSEAPTTASLPTLEEPREPTSVVAVSNTQLITVTTDILEVVIDKLGGDIVRVRLLNHLTKMSEDGGQPITLLQRTADSEYIAQSGLIGGNATDTAEGRPLFYSSEDSYQLRPGEDGLAVDLKYNQNGVAITKRFEFTPADYQIAVRYIIDNPTDSPWSSTFYGQIRRDSQQPTFSSTGGMQMQAFLGPALREPEKNYAKYDFSDIEDDSVKASLKGGWIAFVQHYFISAWVPPQNQQNKFTLRKQGDRDRYLFAFTGEKINIAPGASGEYRADFYVGPKNQSVLADLADYLDLTIDYGFLWMLAKPIFMVMQFIYDFIGNWGWSIILLTVLIKILLYPLSAAGLKSMARMRELQPEMARIKELYGDDRQRAGQEQMALFKKHRVNPAGGCLPMLLQMPVFIALFWVLSESVEIRHSAWIGWIQDLSSKDPLFILPLIMGASMYLMQKLQPMPTDPMQAKVFQLMPIAFTVFCLWFPAGLVLYWTVNNLLSILQQMVVNRQISAAKSK